MYLLQSYYLLQNSMAHNTQEDRWCYNSIF